jgi:hypothetical protein
MGLGTILLIILILTLVSVMPTRPGSRPWGMAPHGVLGLAVVVLVVWLSTPSP